MKMQFNTLGNTKTKVSRICLGTMTWGDQNTKKEAHKQLDYAIKEARINFIDTAEIYSIPPKAETCGKTEEYIGDWLQKNPSMREKMVIASKMMGPGPMWIRNGDGLDPDAMAEALEGSLTRMKTDYIDLYQLHWPQRRVNKFGEMNYKSDYVRSRQEEEEHIINILKAFYSLQSSGKVRYLGLSNETPWGAMKFLEIARREGLPEIQTIQNPYNLLNRHYETGLSEVSLYEGVGLLAYSPLAGGVLSGKYQNEIPKGSRYDLWGKHRQHQNLNHRAFKATEKIMKLAKKYDMTPVQLSLAWVNSQKFLDANIIGATSLEQLKENISSLEYELPKEAFQEINNMFSQNPNPATF